MAQVYVEYFSDTFVEDVDNFHLKKQKRWIIFAHNSDTDYINIKFWIIVEKLIYWSYNMFLWQDVSSSISTVTSDQFSN